MAFCRKLFLALALTLLGVARLPAQTGGTVTGRVVDATSQQGLSGVAIRVGARSTATQADGRFTLSNVAPGTYTLQASRISYTAASQSVTVRAGEATTVELRLQPGAVALEGVVAVGYGQRRIRDVTGSVQAVSAEQFNTGRVVSPDQLIQGKVAGVQVITSGEPGGGSSVRIRGGTSVTASNEPLYVVDGVPLQSGSSLNIGKNDGGSSRDGLGQSANTDGTLTSRSPLSFINPEDIARITVLKDASSTAIYGSRGANGVIIIETKNGATRGPQFTYTGTASTSRISSEANLLTADQFRTVVQARTPNLAKYLGNASTNWRDAVERDATGQEHSLAVAGAGQTMNYRLSLNYLDQGGVLRGSDLQRTSGALSYNHRLFQNRLNLRANFRGARTSDQFTPNDVLGSANSFDPTQPIRTANGTYFEQLAFKDAPNNPLATLEKVVEEGTTYRSVGNVEAQYRLPFFEAVSLTGRLGYDVGASERRSFFPSTLQSQIESPAPCDTDNCPTGTFARSNPRASTGLLDLFGNYTSKVGGNSNLDVTAGYSYEDTNGDNSFFQVRGLNTDLLGANGVPAGVEVTPRVDPYENKLISFFGRANYTLNDRYLLTVSVRRDGSSRFGPGNQWGTFPAVALAWRANEESFLRDVSWLSDLKVRASYGVNGNQAVPNYLYLTTYRYGDAFTRAQFGNEFVSTLRPSSFDPNFKWEETTSYNLGLDYGILDNRISGSLEYYRKNTDDLILRVPVAALTQATNRITTNLGSVRNTGFEASVNARVLDGGRRGFTYDASLNAATNKNRLTQVTAFLGGVRQIRVGDISGGVGSTVQVLQAGAPVNSFYLYQHKRGANGRPVVSDTLTNMYVDQNGDGAITEADRVLQHSPAPVWTLGHTSQVGYRNVDMSFTLRAYLGNYVYNNVASSQGYYDALTGNAGLVNLDASVLENNFKRPQYFSDVYLEDASFLRMDNITLGYTVPRMRSMQNVRVFGTVQNAFTVTGYSGVDPEAGQNGIDRTIYPRSRTFTAGVSLGF